jgi:hypothetical protein
MGEKVFIGPKSSGRSVLRAYVRYYSTTVQRLFRTTKYYTVDFVNSSVVRSPLWCTSAVLFIEYDCTIYQSVCLVGDHRTSALKDSNVHPTFQRTSTLKDKSVRLPTLAYIRTKRQTRRQIFKMPFWLILVT